MESNLDIGVRNHSISSLPYTSNHEERTLRNKHMPTPVNQVFCSGTSQNAAAKRLSCIFHPDGLSVL